MTSTGQLSVLFVAAPLVGHVTPMLPLASAAAAAGHRVRLLTGGDACGVATAGVRSVAVCGPPGIVTGLGIALRNPRLAVREASGRAGIPLAGKIFGALNAGMLDRVIAEAEAFAPDVVVHEPFAPAGLVAARRTGVRAVLHQISLWDPRTVHDAAMNDLARRRALPLDRTPDATISITPTALMDVPSARRIRGIPASGDGPLPAWLERPPRRPRIIVSRSTTNAGPGPDLARQVASAASGIDADIVIVRGRLKRAVPPNVHLVEWVPLDRALQNATAFVHHGGSGGLLQALAAGVPQLATFGIADRRHNASLLERSGAGIGAETGEITTATLERLVTDDSIRRRAGELRCAIDELPAPAAALDVLAGRPG